MGNMGNVGLMSKFPSTPFCPVRPHCPFCPSLTTGKNSLSLLSFEQIGTVLNKLKRRKTLLNTGDNQKNVLK
jgi:hypothetical protein